MTGRAPDASSLPDDAQPVVCVKSARLVSAASGVKFAPSFPRTHSHPYDAVDTAVCEAGETHVAPTANCRCGFHGVRSREDLWRLPPAREAVVLDVELAGTVIEHEHGVRASDQAVLGVHLPHRCTSWRCRRTTAGVAQYRSSAYESELAGWIGLRPVCQRCAKRRLINVADLASRLGVEVCIDDEDRAATPGPRPYAPIGLRRESTSHVRAYLCAAALVLLVICSLVTTVFLRAL